MLFAMPPVVLALRLFILGNLPRMKLVLGQPYPLGDMLLSLKLGQLGSVKVFRNLPKSDISVVRGFERHRHFAPQRGKITMAVGPTSTRRGRKLFAHVFGSKCHTPLVASDVSTLRHPGAHKSCKRKIFVCNFGCDPYCKML